MGYYIYTTESDFRIKKEDFGKAFDRACELNRHDELKGGGTFARDGVRERWFSWVTPNYHETCSTFAEVLTEFRLEPMYQDGDIVELNFESKIGDEDVLLAYIAPFVQDGSYIEWQGEDGDRWRYVFRGGVMYVSHAKVTFPEEDEFSKVDYRVVDDKVVPYIITFDPKTDSFVSRMREAKA
jgi:hypothetical protein